MEAVLASGDHRYFEEEVRPILVARCYECHSEEAGKRKGGLWLDRREGWQRGGDSGPSLVPGDPEQSLLVEAIQYRAEGLHMPPKTRLPDEEIATLVEWIARGAPDPRDAVLAAAVRNSSIDYEKARRGWAYRPLQEVTPPPVRDGDWPLAAIDRFVLAKIEGGGLVPARDAEPAVLLRRVHFDLTGLPPTRAEVDAFVGDPSPVRFAAIVDDLLARRSFAEKWGRHWLDVARYADSNGGDRNFTFPQAWRYRNWVIEAFHRDKSYYDFVREQIAGDLLPYETDGERASQLTGSTFLALGPKMLTERDKEKLFLDTVDEQIDTLGRAFLGLAFGCARCHDHKFDPVSQEDYFGLAGIFRSTEIVQGTRNGCVNVASWVERPLPGPAEEELRAKVERLELAMRLTVEKSFRKKAGGKKAAQDLPFAGVIYDDADAELAGSWTESTWSSQRFGAGYVHDDQKNKGSNRAVFRGSLPESGTYEVRVAYNAGGNRAASVPVTIEARDRIETVMLDQRKKPSIGGLFEPVGRYRFEKGGRVNVIIETGGTEGYVIVDAVQFVSVRDLDREEMALAAAAEKAETKEKSLLAMSEGELKKELSRLIKELEDEEVVMAPRDAAEPSDIHLRVRGETGRLGEKVARGFPRVLHAGPPPSIPAGSSGRIELANWLTGEENALLDRVIVNRIWHHLFGRGIVATTDNFGALGSGPSHPELLDYLGLRFRENGGSIKSLVRDLVLSRAYRLSADAPEELAEADPENALFGRRERRRLSAEEIRDGILQLSGQLDRAVGQATATPYGVDLDKPMSFAKETLRTVYLPVARNNLVPEMALFDAANPDLVSGGRSRTTVPTQALYLLNSEFLRESAARLGKEAMQAAALPGDEVTWLYQTLLGRSPDPVESRRALGLMADLSGGSEQESDLEAACGHLAHALLASAEFLTLE